MIGSCCQKGRQLSWAQQPFVTIPKKTFNLVSFFGLTYPLIDTHCHFLQMDAHCEASMWQIWEKHPMCTCVHIPCEKPRPFLHTLSRFFRSLRVGSFHDLGKRSFLRVAFLFQWKRSFLKNPTVLNEISCFQIQICLCSKVTHASPARLYRRRRRRHLALIKFVFLYEVRVILPRTQDLPRTFCILSKKWDLYTDTDELFVAGLVQTRPVNA